MGVKHTMVQALSWLQYRPCLKLNYGGCSNNRYIYIYATQCACILYILHCNGHFRVFTYYYKFVCTGFNISLDLSHLHVCVYHGIQAS